MTLIENSLQYIPDFYDAEKIDIIGDIHGCYKKLVRLLELMGYKKRDGVYYHPERFAIFLGDLIDRGPQIREVLELVYSMIEKKYAVSVMGNHEFNYISILTYNENNEPYRAYTRRTEETFKQLRASEYIFWRNKFTEMPMFLDLGKLRIIHATWDQRYIDYFFSLEKKNTLSESILKKYYEGKDKKLYFAIRFILKGKELKVKNKEKFFKPEYISWLDTLRIRWWQDFDNPSWKDIEVKKILRDNISEPLPDEFYEIHLPYPTDAVPVFFGHFSLPKEMLGLLAPNVACLDYGAVYHKSNPLVAYRWSGEQILDEKNFFYTK